ncbi:MAG: DMT family transporter [Deltaproteobacteria bacterium]|nr:DMT family transporter [Deltaproteobacteria bacterium]MBW2219722.1 DMT family transporter [Deltaproteobacteria bacterium]
MTRTIPVLIIGVISISFAAIFIRFCDDMPSMTIAGFRFVIASLILLLISCFKKHNFGDLSVKEFFWCTVSGAFLALHMILWIIALKMTSVASAVVLVTTNPIFVAIFSYVLLKERQSKELMIGIVLSFVGSAVIAIGDGGISGSMVLDKTALTGDILALLGAVMASGYLIIGSKMREKMDTFSYILIVYTITAAIVLMVVFAGGYPVLGFKTSSYISVALLAIVPQLLGHTSFNWVLKHIKTSMVAITILGEPIGATILAYFFFKETISFLQFLGILGIFTAIVIASRKGAKN